MRQDLDEKVREIFSQYDTERLDRLSADRTPEAIVSQIASALAGRVSPEQAYDIGFHMVDWNSNAAFIFALLLFPEHFDTEDIAEGVEAFLVHAPNHTAAAAKLYGCPVQDIFGVDALSGKAEDTTSGEKI